jgi:hypothetical protein
MLEMIKDFSFFNPEQFRNLSQIKTFPFQDFSNLLSQSYHFLLANTMRSALCSLPFGQNQFFMDDPMLFNKYRPLSLTFFAITPLLFLAP